jgi:hypothetical protein
MNATVSAINHGRGSDKLSLSETRSWRKNAIFALIIAALLTLGTKTIYAGSYQAYSDSDGDGVDTAGVSDSGYVDLNSFEVSTIDVIGVEAYAQGGPRNSDANADINGVVSAFSDSSSHVDAVVYANDLTQNEDGDWIAASTYSTESGYSYDVDFGSGELELDSYADADVGGSASTDAYVGY